MELASGKTLASYQGIYKVWLWYLYDRLIMSDAIAAFGAARDALNANIFEGQVGDDDSTGLHRSLERLINSVAPAAEAAALRPPPARPRVQPQPPPRDEDLLWSNPTPRSRAASDAESLDEVSSDHRVPRAARRLRRLGASAF